MPLGIGLCLVDSPPRGGPPHRCSSCNSDGWESAGRGTVTLPTSSVMPSSAKRGTNRFRHRRVQPSPKEDPCA